MKLIDNIKSFFLNKLEYIKGYHTSHGRSTIKNKILFRLKVIYVICLVYYRKDLFSKDIPALTYATFTSLIPLLAVLFAVARMCGLDEAFISWLMTALSGQPELADRVVTYVQNYLLNTSNQAIILVGIAFMLYPLYSLMFKIEISFSGIWGVTERKIGKMILDYILFYLLFLLILFMSLFVYVKAVFFLSCMKGYALVESVAPVLPDVISLIPLIIFFILIFCHIPNTRVRVSKVLVPAVVCSVVMELLRTLYIYGQVYLTSYNVIYGSLAILPLFLLWLQTAWTIVETGVAWCYASQNLHLYNPGSELLK